VVVVAIVVVVVDVVVADVDELEDELDVGAVVSLAVTVVLAVSLLQAAATNMKTAATTRTRLDMIPLWVLSERVYPECCPFLRCWGQPQPLALLSHRPSEPVLTKERASPNRSNGAATS
jgi:hypothetical protein